MNLLDKIFGNKNKKQTTGFIDTNKKPVYVLKDSINKANQGIILFNDSDVQHILNKSGKHATSNEYQVHYWGLIFRHKAEDNSILDICIPTVFFNYKQQVNPAHIDFELSDVDDTSDAILPIHEMKVKEILASNFKKDLESYFQITLEPLSVAINSLHCHPGQNTNQSFSGTDLSKKKEDLGVVFPLASAENDRPNFAGIMVRKTKNNNVIAHYEYRTANGILNEDMTYKEGRCAALISKKRTKPSLIASMLGVKTIVNNYSTMKYCSMNEHFSNIQAAFEQMEFEAFTDTVVSDNVELKQTYSRPVYNNPDYQHHDLFDPFIDEFDSKYNNTKPSINDTKKQEIIIVGTTKEEYEKAQSNLETFKEFAPLSLTLLELRDKEQLLEYYDKWYMALYETNDDELYRVLDEADDLIDIKDELVFECLTLIDSIQEYISELKDTIETYEEENKSKNPLTEDTLEQEMIEQMKNGLIENGWAKSVISLKTDDQIEELYAKLTEK